MFNWFSVVRFIWLVLMVVDFMNCIGVLVSKVLVIGVIECINRMFVLWRLECLRLCLFIRVIGFRCLKLFRVGMFLLVMMCIGFFSYVVRWWCCWLWCWYSCCWIDWSGWVNDIGCKVGCDVEKFGCWCFFCRFGKMFLVFGWIMIVLLGLFWCGCSILLDWILLGGFLLGCLYCFVRDCCVLVLVEWLGFLVRLVFVLWFVLVVWLVWVLGFGCGFGLIVVVVVV